MCETEPAPISHCRIRRAPNICMHVDTWYHSHHSGDGHRAGNVGNDESAPANRKSRRWNVGQIRMYSTMFLWRQRHARLGASCWRSGQFNCMPNPLPSNPPPSPLRAMLFTCRSCVLQARTRLMRARWAVGHRERDGMCAGNKLQWMPSMTRWNITMLMGLYSTANSTIW